jgi:hypothetical protein
MVQMLLVHVWPLGQVRPQPLQFRTSLLSLTQAPLHVLYGLLQMNPQFAPSHVGAAFNGGTHMVQLGPHAFTSSATHDEPQTCPLGHWHTLFVHVAPLAQANAVPHPPQLSTLVLSLTQAPAQRVYGLAQVNPQLVPSQVAVPFAGAVHSLQLVPHALTSSASHDEPQRRVPLGHWHELPMHCFPPVHALAHPPQLALSLVSSAQAPLHPV